MLVWIKLVICLAILLIAGTRLSKYGDIIAEKTGLGRIWIGVVLLATITSLPELATGISSVAILGKPDLTLGDLFGSNLVNLFIIAILDVLYTRGPILSYLGTGLVLAAIASSFLIGIVAASIFVAQNVYSLGLFGYIGLYSPVILCLYLLVQYMLIRFQRSQQSKSTTASPPTTSYREVSLIRVIAFFVIAALATAVAGTWLAFIGDEITIVTGLKASFVGSLFIAICTSAPEIVVSISALRLGALDMAVGNVIGSNLFNMGVIVFIDDLFFTEGPILSYVSTDHIFTGLVAMLMTCVVIIGLIYRPRSWPRIWVGIDTIGLIVLYCGAIAVLYSLGRF